MAALALARDTDADWRALGETQPFWGVLTHPDYRTENLTPQALKAFYGSGVAYIDDIVVRLERATGVAPRGRALDFGCGAGRLAEAMAAYTQTTGLDISPGMLAKAREQGGKATYVETLPAGSFDWINSFIVFQHIAPERGLALMETLLARLAPGGHVSLHVTAWRELALTPAPARSWRALVRALIPEVLLTRLRPAPATGTISMYDYDLSQVLARLNRAGLEELTLVSTDHGGHHGVILLGRKTTAPTNSSPKESV